VHVSDGELDRFASKWGLSIEAKQDLAELLDSTRSLVSTPPPQVETLAAVDPNATMAMDSSEPTGEIADPFARERYEMLMEVGRGGFGEVRRVHDHHLNRTIAMKVLHERLQSNPEQRRRFQIEAQVTAQLQHPGVVPVHDIGLLDDGRTYYTMKEVQGRTLAAILSELHDTKPRDRWARTESGWSLRRCVGMLQRAAEAVGYAHARGVIHRDIKPLNLMVGEHGEVHVVDWGLARVRGVPDVAGFPALSGNGSGVSYHSRAGSIVGTIGYMSPEQARGIKTELGAPTDVFALGGVLYEILCGRRPRHVEELAELVEVLDDPIVAPSQRTRRPVPPELEAIAMKALAPATADRHVDASAFATALRRWLDGEAKRAQALTLVSEALERQPTVANLRDRARALRAEVQAMSISVPPFAAVSDKRPLWDREDEADRLDEEADRLEITMVQTLQAALTYAPELPEAHEALADHYHRHHVLAERESNAAAAARHAQLLRGHDRGRYAAYLEGFGKLSLEADAPGATATLHRYERRDRRLVAEPVRELALPVEGLALAKGSYLVEIRAPGRDSVHYPVWIRRQMHWSMSDPDGDRHPIRMPAEGSLGAEVYVPAGWWTTGDPVAFSALPPGSTWQESFVIQRFSVDKAAYKVFLDALVAAGRDEEALLHAPQQAGADGTTAAQLWPRNADGTFDLGDQDPTEPVVWIDWYGAQAYAAWYAGETGLPWRPPSEMEWEKAARGVDGRAFPMGNLLDPTWARIKASSPEPSLVSNDAYPEDVSPYGVRGMAGNVMNWCEELYTPSGPPLDLRHGTPARVEASPQQERVLRGGFWWCSDRDAHAALRLPRPATFRFDCVSFRLARTV
jgi:serine/threonine-protein kinase